jgi:RNA polymerase sigma-70 factor (ECF subfamily)
VSGTEPAFAAFVARLALSPEAAERARPALQAALAQAEAAWPRVEVDPVQLAVDLADRLAKQPDPVAALDGWHAADLWLASACARAEPTALEAFERDILAGMPAFLAQFRAGPSFVDEVRQRVRERLLVAPAGGLPRIAAYSGRGPLRAWVRVVSTRVALDVLRERKVEPDAEPDVAERVIDAAATPEVAALRARYLPHFQQALARAVEALTSKQRNLLRMHHIDAYSLDELATTYGVHRATVARWLADARAELLDRTQTLLRAELGLSPSDFASLATALRSQLHLSLQRLSKGT